MDQALRRFLFRPIHWAALGDALRFRHVPTHRYQNHSGSAESDLISVTLLPADPFKTVTPPLTITQQMTVLPTPIQVNLSGTFAPEGSASSFTVNFTDAGSIGDHWLTIDWNDHSPLQQIDLGTLTSTSVVHVYGDNAPNGGNYTPTFTISRSSDPISSRSGSVQQIGGNCVECHTDVCRRTGSSADMVEWIATRRARFPKAIRSP